MHRKMTLACSLIVLSTIAFVLVGPNASAGKTTVSVPASLNLPGQPVEAVLIRANKPYNTLVSRIDSLGGRVTHQYNYVNAVAAEVPRDALPMLRDIVGAAAITKDLEIKLPDNVDTQRGRNLASSNAVNEIQAESSQALNAAGIQELATVNPNAYLLNDSIANVTPLFAQNITGAGVTVAVIDSGIRPGFPHITLDGSVVRCDDFVGDGLGCVNSSNDPHGTFVAGMISANVVFQFSPASAIRNAVLAECPACFLNPPANTQIPMIGTAPLSSIYALRVFGPTGNAPISRVISAIERVIELREMFDNGVPGGVNTQVANMSLGGSTINPGRDLLDNEVDVLLEKGIVPVIAAGNAGPSSLTVGSPGTARSAITVGAASLAHNERIVERLQFGPVIGPLFRPFLGTQTAYFSSRGPDADGRLEPDVVSNGFDCFGQGVGATNTITFGSGTSASTPSVSGVAALLRQAFPGATARQIRNAIIAAGNAAIFADGSTVLDRGAGYVNGLGARNLLAAGSVPDDLPNFPNANSSVKVNVEKATFLNVQDGLVSDHATNLKPGQRKDILYRVAPNTKQVIVVLGNVTPSLPPSQQNQLFGDDILLAIHSAKTSEIGDGDYSTLTFTLGGAFVVNNPETGVMRITLNGDWTNAGTISADVSILSVTDPIPQFTTQGKIADLELQFFPVNIPAGISQAEFQLGWRQDWGTFPTADVDLVLINPNGQLNLDGASLNNPERAVISNPIPGQWIAVVAGFQIPSSPDKFELRVALDGRVVK
ncbi:MAG: hypothetical protein C5B55_13640 [Blastocatellia bacterium]|nr:MAG: hypothetical protein C5B55_13640 [Blastocatellia bacterium]